MYIIAKENPKNPEGFTYVRSHETINNQEHFNTTTFRAEALEFGTKEEAVKVYWLMNHYFYGYKVY